MADHPRYRVDDGVHYVDIRVTSSEQVFDNRDPAPFRERDLDPDLVDYLVDAAEDLASHRPFRVAFWFPAAHPVDDLAHAFRAHFEYELHRLERRRSRQRHVGQIALLLGLGALVVLLTLAQLVPRLPSTMPREAIREGFVILSWIVLWRPVDVLIYEWLPVRRQRKLFHLLLEAPIELRTGPGPDHDRGPQLRPARSDAG